MKRLAAFTLFFSLSLGIAQAATPGSPALRFAENGSWMPRPATSRNRCSTRRSCSSRSRRSAAPTCRTPTISRPLAGPPTSRPWAPSWIALAARNCARSCSARCNNPADLKISAAADDIRFAADGASPRGISPGERSSRVDRYGTARIDPALARRSAGGERKIRSPQPAGNHVLRGQRWRAASDAGDSPSGPAAHHGPQRLPQALTLSVESHQQS